MTVSESTLKLDEKQGGVKYVLCVFGFNYIYI